MTQYCRYCNNANLIGDDIFYCQPKNEVYGIEKSKRVNKCKLFDFNENDLWRCDENGNFETYKPRPQKQVNPVYAIFKQMTIDGAEE